MDLPDEIILLISEFLSIRDILNFSMSCHHLNVLLENDMTWKIFYKRDFALTRMIKEWKCEYKTQMKICQLKEFLVKHYLFDSELSMNILIEYLKNKYWNETVSSMLKKVCKWIITSNSKFDTTGRPLMDYFKVIHIIQKDKNSQL